MHIRKVSQIVNVAINHRPEGLCRAMLRNFFSGECSHGCVGLELQFNLKHCSSGRKESKILRGWVSKIALILNTTWLLLYRTLFRRCWLRSRLPSPGLALGALRKCSPSLAIIRHRCTLPHNPSPSFSPWKRHSFFIFLDQLPFYMLQHKQLAMCLGQGHWLCSTGIKLPRTCFVHTSLLSHLSTFWHFFIKK